MNRLFTTLTTQISNLSLQCFYDEEERQTLLEKLVQKYSVDSLSYLSLEGDKKYFINKDLDGFIAYVVIQNIAVSLADPICPSTKTLQVLNEFKVFCSKNNLKICFCSITENFANLLKRNNYIISKYGEEALLDLTSYSLSGGKTEKLRQKLRRAENSGIRTAEYFPGIDRNSKLEEQILSISQDWFMHKQGGQLTFALGALNFDNPLGRRYFVGFDLNEEVVSILMFSPFDGRNGYFLDVMRRKSDSIPGIMEKTIIDAAMKMKSEGTRWVSLGLAPLAGINPSDPETTFLERLFSTVFHHGNSSYNFKSLYQYKKKFNPSCWNSRYVAHERGITAIKVAYVMAKARNVNGVLKKTLTSLAKYIFEHQIPLWYEKKDKTISEAATLYKDPSNSGQADNGSIDYV